MLFSNNTCSLRLLPSSEKAYALSILSGALFLMALPPMAYFFLALVCFVPLICALEQTGPVKAVFCGFLFGLMAYIAIPISLLPWGWDVVLSSALISGGFFALLALLCKAIAKLPLVNTVWVAFPLAYALVQLLGEHVLSVPVLLSVFYPVDWLDGRGIFGLIGGHGVDYLVCCINAVLAGVMIEEKKRVCGSAAACFLTLFIGLHFANSGTHVQAMTSLDVITVDNSMSYQRVRQMGYSMEIKQAITNEMDQMTMAAIDQSPDLILWPEGGDGLSIRQVAGRRSALASLANKGDYRLIAGSKFFSEAGEEYNVAEYLVNGEFRDQIQKKHRVPIIENKLVAGSNGVFTVENSQIGVGICFDIAFPDTISAMVKAGAQGLIMLSNDASFGLSGLTYMHIRYVAIRALENAREVIFLSNTGPSVLISNSGRVASGYMHTAHPRNEGHRLHTYSGYTFYTTHTLLVGFSGVMLLITAMLTVAHLCRK